MSIQLTPENLIAGYCQGLFPMADYDGTINWYDVRRRAIIPLDAFHVPKRLARRVRHGGFEIRVDTCFREVMLACAGPRADHEGTWISDEMVEVYTALHEMGFAHSVEAWAGGELVGGLYGVAIRGLFAGESMFSRATDASKVALVHLVERLQRGGFQLLDSQYIVGEHMLQFGTIEISRAEYQRRLAAALAVETTF
ncbi:leucyl/phenylalanyl-tRNA--protein transferase [Kouleothrix aurantiaca]|uniref:Leucyl/phenylalanyl-tRNA--protein transferase n=1 Tax=Kouleothrix aurantiaca TaxID=186479 RepID=A0A0P9DIP1_9CHLR|nr:leucyl/phenylalanyl-tRNA--protein transferase [Kouleothrix aurantiaca]